MQLEHFVLSFLVVAVVVLLVNAQTGPFPPRLSISGAVVSPSTRSQLRNEKQVRVRRPIGLRAQQNTFLPGASSHIIEDPKPVTEPPEEEDSLPDAFLPQLLREQQIAQAQQAQFQQAAAAFLGGEPNSIQDVPSPPLSQEEPVARFPERERQPQISSAPSSRPVFNDYIRPNTVANSQRFGLERPLSNPAPVQQRVNVIRTRPSSPSVREPRPHFEDQTAAPTPPSAPLPVRSRPKPVRPRPITDENQLQQDEREVQFSQRRQRPVAQTLRKWREENEDGSITWGYENDDGSFKEEIIGIDCITKGTYGYVDPDGNKREYGYETGIKCDPNTRETEAEVQENGSINYEENKAVLPNGIEIDMSQLGKRKSNRPGANYRN